MVLNLGFPDGFLKNCLSGIKTEQKKNLCPISKDGNIATYKVDICGSLKTPIEFCNCYGSFLKIIEKRLCESLVFVNTIFSKNGFSNFLVFQ